MTQEEQILDLQARLKASFDADDANAKHAVQALKSQLEKRLRLDYADFLLLQKKEPSAEYYEAALFVMERVFATLKRNGIELE